MHLSLRLVLFPLLLTPFATLQILRCSRTLQDEFNLTFSAWAPMQLLFLAAMAAIITREIQLFSLRLILNKSSKGQRNTSLTVTLMLLQIMSLVLLTVKILESTQPAVYDEWHMWLQAAFMVVNLTLLSYVESYIDRGNLAHFATTEKMAIVTFMLAMASETLPFS